MLKFEIKHYQQVTSTNEVAKKMLKEGEAVEGTVILADFQTQGRGRGKNSWFSEPGKSLLFSLLLKPELKASLHFQLNEFISLAIIDTLNEFQGEAKIKWPNDIYYKGGKLAGLLIENTLYTDKIVRSIIGIGFNLNNQKFPHDLPNPVSLSSSDENPIHPENFLMSLLDNVSARYNQLNEGDGEGLHKEYLRNIYLLGQRVFYVLKDKENSGILEDVKIQGEIVIRTDSGQLESYQYGEIKLCV